MKKRFIREFLDYYKWSDDEKRAAKAILLITAILTLSSVVRLVAMLIA